MKDTLLIADDDAELCSLYRQFLTEYGYHVETSLHAMDCLEKLRRVDPAVLVLDPELPWGGGDGILAWLREERPTHAVPVILTAMAAHPGARAENIEPPIVDYLPKPFSLAALLESVRSAVGELG